MTTRTQALTIITLGATLVLAPAQTNQTTQTTTDASPPALSPTEQLIQDIKNPFPWMTWGGDLRIRNEYFNNALSLTSDPHLSPYGAVHAQDYFRYRGRVWTSITPIENLSLNVRVAAEPREFMEPGFSDTFFQREGMQWRYGIIDNLNVKWKQAFDQPVTLIVGRQDIFLGDGWLVGDGTPEDGSFTTFLDSARATVELKDLHTTIDAIGIIQNGRPDAWLPTIGASTDGKGNNPEPLLLTDQNEKGAILWLANKSLPAANVDTYFIYKHDSAINDYPASLFSDNADIFTFGGRVSGLVAEHFQYSAEGAYQFGTKQYEYNPPLVAPLDEKVHNLSAFGVNSKVSYLFKDELNNQISLSYEYLSGDDPKTGTDEMFDVLWGRWPRWSEMYNVYSYVSETRVGQTANLHRIGPTWSLTPFKDMQFSASYYALFADQPDPTQATVGTVFTKTGDFRGHFIQAVLKYKFSQHMSAHLWSEFLFPGDFYVDHGMITFLRAEVMFTL